MPPGSGSTRPASACSCCGTSARPVGVLGASWLSEPRLLGLDAAAPAAFLALLAPRLRGREAWVVALAAAMVALIAVPFVPVGFPVLIAALVGVVAGLLPRPARRQRPRSRRIGRGRSARHDPLDRHPGRRRRAATCSSWPGCRCRRRCWNGPGCSGSPALLPVVLLSALVAVQTFSIGSELVIDARAAGLAVAGIAVWRRWPFLVVVALAAFTTALVRMWVPGS